MKKNLIALAVISAFAAPSAFAAEATIYGTANLSLDVTDNGNVTTNKVASNASTLGFKGSENLGNGTSAIWQIETALAMDGTTTTGTNNTWATRNTFAGLSGDSWGTLILGQHDTPYKIAARSQDLFADTIADNRSLIGQTGGGVVNHDARLGNVVAYISPSLNGVTLAAAYVASAEAATASNQTKGTAYSVAALYGAGPLNLDLAYQSIKGGSPGTGAIVAALPPGDTATAWTLGGSYTIDAFLVTASYEKLGSSGSIGNALDQTNWYIGGKYSVNASDAVKVAYSNAGKINSATDTDASQVSVGYDHNLSKRTTVYALYTRLSNKNNAGYTLGFSDATTDAIASPALGKDLSAWSFGLKHSF